MNPPLFSTQSQKRSHLADSVAAEHGPKTNERQSDKEDEDGKKKYFRRTVMANDLVGCAQHARDMDGSDAYSDDRRDQSNSSATDGWLLTFVASSWEGVNVGRDGLVAVGGWGLSL